MPKSRATLLGVQEVCLSNGQTAELDSAISSRLMFITMLFISVQSILFLPIYTNQSRMLTIAQQQFAELQGISRGIQDLSIQLEITWEGYRADFHQYSSDFKFYSAQQHADMVELADIEISIAGDDFNITLDLADLDITTKHISALLDQVYSEAGDAWAKQLLTTASEIAISTAKAEKTLDDTYNDETGWAARMEKITSATADTLDIVADVIEAIHTVIGAISSALEGAQNVLLSRIAIATEATAEALSEGFRAKVLEVVDTTSWDINMPEAFWADARIIGVEFAAMECGACEGGFVGTPMACEGCAIELLEVEGVDGDELNGPGSEIISVAVKFTPKDSNTNK